MKKIRTQIARTVRILTDLKNNMNTNPRKSVLSVSSVFHSIERIAMNLKFTFLLLISLVVLVAARARAQSSPEKLSADKILRLSDMGRNGWSSYAVHTTIENFEDGKLKETGRFDVMIKGADKTLVKFLNADVKGRYLLMVGDDMWLYMPDTRRPIRITPLQRLIGDASNGDVARTRYAEDYSARLLRQEVLDGTPCYVLDLHAKRDGATYNHIVYWVAKGTYRPKRAEIYLTSGKHYKSITFDKYEETNGRTLLTQMTITDRLRPGRTTIMLYGSYGPREFPDKYFNKDYLENLR